jgi:tetraprenyl-beta-curcumene synthase
MADRRLAWALVAVIVRYLATIEPHAKRELARWRQHALAIPDPELRAHVLRPFDADDSALGASLFAVLAPLRIQRRLVRLLIAYVLLWSYVDVRTERDPDADPWLYDTLVDALRPGMARVVPLGRRDGGYLAALLRTCHLGCRMLPAWSAVESAALCLAHDGREVQMINHGPPSQAEARLRAWAADRPGMSWNQRCAAASSPLAIHALMALAARSVVGHSQARASAAAYQPVSALGVLYDHLLDRSEDRTHMNHSYVRYLVEPYTGARELRGLTALAVRSVRGLPMGERHLLILSAMVAMFLSRESSSRVVIVTTERTLLDPLGMSALVLTALLRMARPRAER